MFISGAASLRASCRRVVLHRSLPCEAQRLHFCLASYRLDKGCKCTRRPHLATHHTTIACQCRHIRLFSVQTKASRPLGPPGLAEEHQHQSKQSRSPLTPIQFLQQFEEEVPSPHGSVGDSTLHRVALEESLIAIEHDISHGHQQDAWISLLAYVDSQPPEKREQLQAHRLFRSNLSKLTSWYILDTLTDQNILLSRSADAGAEYGSEASSADSRSGEANVSAPNRKSAHDLITSLRERQIFTPRIHLQLLDETVRHSIRILNSSTNNGPLSPATEFCSQQVFYLWHSITSAQYKSDAHNMSDDTIPRGAQVLEWSYLPTVQDLESKAPENSSFRDYLRLLLPLYSPDSYSLQRLEVAVLLTLYFVDRIAQTRTRSSTSLGQHSSIDTSTVPLVALLQQIFDKGRPTSAPPEMFRHASRSNSEEQQAYTDVIRHFGLQQESPSGARSTTSSSMQSSTGSTGSLADSDTAPVDRSQHSTDAIDHEVLPDHIRQLVDDIKKRAGRAIERRDAKLAESVFRSVVNHEIQATADTRLPPDVYEHLIRMFLTLGFPNQVFRVLELMKRLSLSVNNKIWTTLLRRAHKLSDKPPIDLLWKAMVQSGVQPDGPAWSARIFALANSHQPLAVMKALDELRFDTVSHQQKDVEQDSDKVSPVDSPWTPDISVVNAALVGFVNHEHLQTYIPQLLAWSSSMGLKPDVTTYNTLINVSMRQSADEAFRLLDRMRERGVIPNEETATVVVTGLFHTDLLDDKGEHEMTEYLLSFLDDVEEQQVGVPMSAKGYTTALSNVLQVKGNLSAGQALIQRMHAKNIALTAEHHTILMDFYLSSKPPLFEAFESFWTTIQNANGGWGVAMDDVFCDRAIERMAEHHRVLGTDKIQQVVDRMLSQRLRPSWPALQSLAKVYHERDDSNRLARLIDDIRSSRNIFANGASKAFGQHDFWSYIVSLGVMADQGFTHPDQLMIRDGQWRERRLRKR